MMREETVLPNLIGGRFTVAEAETTAAVRNPATEAVLAHVPFSTPAEVERAVSAASEAFPGWSRTPVAKRYRVLFAYQQLLMQHREELARLITQENGKDSEDARGEVLRGIECVEYAASVAMETAGTVVRDVAEGMDQEVLRYPLGVCAGITPFNFPAMVPLWMVPLAIAAGNTFVLKPSERTPLSAQRLVEWLSEAGLPPGVCNVVHGGRAVVQTLLGHPDVRAISFVGSQPVAEYVHARATALHKRVQCGSGAKNHAIVLPDADLDRTVANLVGAAFGNAGQRCMAVSAVVAVGDVGDPLVDRLRQAADETAAHMGDGLSEGVRLGPMIGADQRARAERYIELGVAEGAELVRDGRRDPLHDGPGFFLGPTLLDRARPDMQVVRDEIFAPVLCVLRADSLDEAIDIVNKSRFGNGAVLYTNRQDAIRRFRDRTEAGMLGVNAGVPTPMGFLPFAGMKDSFYGDLHLTGREGFEFYTRTKVLTTRVW